MKILKTDEEGENKYKIAVALSEARLKLLSMDFKSLINIQTANPNEQVISLINLSPSTFMSFSKDGQINVYKNSTLEVEKESTIFHVKSDDYIDTCLIRSKEFILFTLQKQKMEFYTVSNFKRSDLWDYFFENDLTRCFKNREGSKIAVVDKSGALTLFNFLKHLD